MYSCFSGSCFLNPVSMRKFDIEMPIAMVMSKNSATIA